LSKLNEEIKTVYTSGIEFTFVFANMHGINNGYPKEYIDSYIESIIPLFNQYGFKYIFLDTLWNRYGISFERIADDIQKRPQGWWDAITERGKIEQGALLRNKKDVPRIAAQKILCDA
jgi:hypothetical protein